MNSFDKNPKIYINIHLFIILQIADTLLSCLTENLKAIV